MTDTIQNPNQQAWEQLFNKYDIPAKVKNHERFEITAAQINEFRQARLMANFDHKTNLPKIFHDNHLAILPISRGKYVISNFQAYHSLECQPLSSLIEESNFKKPSLMKLPDHLQSFHIIPNETVAINYAYAAGILADFLGEDDLYATLAGRKGTDTFDFDIKNFQNSIYRLSVDKVQIEIDATFEGINSLSIIEAKLNISDDFLVRQLYYPFRFLSNIKQINKKVRPVFLIYSSGTFHLYEYEFSDPCLYNSLNLVRYQPYIVSNMTITIETLEELVKNIQVQPELDNVSFPQADSFTRIVNLCELLVIRKRISKEEVVAKFGFVARQSDYYTNAARYLGLLVKKHKEGKLFYVLSNQGRQIMAHPYRQRQIELSKCILQHRIFYDVFKIWIEKGELPTNNEIADIMTQLQLPHLNNPQAETYCRRASTVRGWLEWIVSQINE